MRSLIFSCTLFVLTACGSVTMLEKRLPLLVGQPVEEAIKAFGPAYNKIETSNGSEYRWVRRASAQKILLHDAAGYIRNVGVGGTECILSVYTNEADQVMKVNYAGDNSMCASFDLGMRNYIKTNA